MRLKMQLPRALLLMVWLIELSTSQDIFQLMEKSLSNPDANRGGEMLMMNGEKNALPDFRSRGIIFSALNHTRGAEEKSAQRSTLDKSECPFTTVDCLCDVDKPSEYVVHVSVKTIPITDRNTRKRKCFTDEDPMVVCENLKCVIIPNNNFEILFQRGKKMVSSNHLDNTKEMDSPLVNPAMNFSRKASGPIILDSLLTAFYPVEYTYPRANGEGGHLRVPRSSYGSNMCRVPSLANSEVTCWKWPNWQTCKQTCIYGHGLDNSGKTIREKSFNCRNSENKWKPHVIRDCEPFMNCKVHLKSPGDLNCVEPTDGPAYCDINCADYDDYKGHGKVRWKCEEKAMLHAKGGKANPLPHCAEFEDAELRMNPPEY